MKNFFLFLPILILFSCESSEIDMNQNEEFVPVIKDELIASNLNPTVLERVKFQFKIKTDGLPMNQLYDSLTFSVSGIDNELRVYNIAYEDPGNPYGNPAEMELVNWYHSFFAVGSYQTRLYGYKNNVKKTLDVLDFTVSQPNDFYNIDWQNFVLRKTSYTNDINHFGLTINAKMISTSAIMGSISVVEVTCGWKNIPWPYSQAKNEESRAILYSNMIDSYGLPTYTEQNNLNELFAEYFDSTLPTDEIIHHIWITAKNKIALSEIRVNNETTLGFKLYAEKK